MLRRHSNAPRHVAGGQVPPLTWHSKGGGGTKRLPGFPLPSYLFAERRKSSVLLTRIVPRLLLTPHSEQRGISRRRRVVSLMRGASVLFPCGLLQCTSGVEGRLRGGGRLGNAQRDGVDTRQHVTKLLAVGPVSPSTVGSLVTVTFTHLSQWKTLVSLTYFQ